MDYVHANAFGAIGKCVTDVLLSHAPLFGLIRKKIALESLNMLYSSVGLFATLLLSLICNFITYLHVVKNPEFFQSQHSDLIEFLLKTHLDQVLFEFGRTTEINRKSCKDLGCNFSM